MASMDYAVIGKSLPRLDAVAKAMAQVQYVDDIRLPGMLVGKLLHSAYAHARIKSIDTSKAEGLPGVMAVVTAADCPDVRAGSSLKDLQVFARDKVRWLGEPVAAVAAVDEDTADRALGLIEVDYEELPAVFDPEEAMQPDAPLVHEGVEGYVGYTGWMA
ncbi:MAG: hypothetical protein Q8R28_12040 [Dehalococcoidia bacterium]|nr:hypothetical protein [Dehalococcoidia bacterium]